jgi:hypothetical protein
VSNAAAPIPYQLYLLALTPALLPFFAMALPPSLAQLLDPAIAAPLFFALAAAASIYAPPRSARPMDEHLRRCLILLPFHIILCNASGLARLQTLATGSYLFVLGLIFAIALHYSKHPERLADTIRSLSLPVAVLLPLWLISAQIVLESSSAFQWMRAACPLHSLMDLSVEPQSVEPWLGLAGLSLLLAGNVGFEKLRSRQRGTALGLVILFVFEIAASSSACAEDTPGRLVQMRSLCGPVSRADSPIPLILELERGGPGSWQGEVLVRSASTLWSRRVDIPSTGTIAVPITISGRGLNKVTIGLRRGEAEWTLREFVAGFPELSVEQAIVLHADLSSASLAQALRSSWFPGASVGPLSPDFEEALAFEGRAVDIVLATEPLSEMRQGALQRYVAQGGVVALLGPASRTSRLGLTFQRRGELGIACLGAGTVIASESTDAGELGPLLSTAFHSNPRHRAVLDDLLEINWRRPRPVDLTGRWRLAFAASLLSIFLATTKAGARSLMILALASLSGLVAIRMSWLAERPAIAENLVLTEFAPNSPHSTELAAQWQVRHWAPPVSQREARLELERGAILWTPSPAWAELSQDHIERAASGFFVHSDFQRIPRRISLDSRLVSIRGQVLVSSEGEDLVLENKLAFELSEIAVHWGRSSARCERLLAGGTVRLRAAEQSWVQDTRQLWPKDPNRALGLRLLEESESAVGGVLVARWRGGEWILLRWRSHSAR